MLSDEEIEEIKKLISQGKTDYKIGQELGHSPNTVKTIREKYKISKVSQKNIGEMHFKNPIDSVRDVIKIIRDIVEMGDLKAEERRELEKLLEKLQETLRVEVDNRIYDERADAVEENNVEWRNLIDRDYVKKDVVTNLSNISKEKDTTIINLRNTIENKDFLISNNKYEMSQLKASNQQEKEDLQDQKEDLLWDNIGLKEEIGDLHDYIGNYLDDAGRWERENLRHEEEVLNGKKTDFDRFVKMQQSNLDGLFFESDEKLKSVEKREEELAEQKEKLKKREDEFDKDKKQIYGMLGEKLKSVEKREGKLAQGEKGLKSWKDEQKDELNVEREKIQDDRRQVTKEMDAIKKTAEEQRTEEQRLQKWQTNLEKTGGFNKFSLPCPHCRKPMLFDATEPEINQKIKSLFGNYVHSGCRLKNEQPKLVTLIPVSYSGEPVIQSGFSPVIRSGGEPMIVMSGLEPVVQSGFPSIIHSGEETKVVEPSGGTMIQSGYSPTYYFGTKNLDKNSKKAGKVSS